MSPVRIVDQTLFAAESAYVDWVNMLRRRNVDFPPNFDEKFAALRWHVAAHHGNVLSFAGEFLGERGIGLPTGPFTVWRRESLPPEADPVDFVRINLGTLGLSVAALEERIAFARVGTDADAPSMIFGLSDPSDPRSIVTRSLVAKGEEETQLHGPGMAGILVPANVELMSVRGVSVDDYHRLDRWKRCEIVGLPVRGPRWDGVGDHAAKQGLVGGLMSPRDAARGRLVRGAPPVGWDLEVDPGVRAPEWRAPDFVALLDELDQDLLGPLLDVLMEPQIVQAALRVPVELPPPATLNGNAMPADPSTAQVSPIAVLQAGVSSDPFASLALGYGTNVLENRPFDVQRFHLGSTWDYMITAPYANGLDGDSEAVELVAYALRPTPALFPPVPAQLEADHLAHQAPPAADANWSASAIARWNRPPRTTLFRVASYAAARRDAGAAVAEALIEERDSGGHRPVAPAVAPEDGEANLVHLADPRITIANDPGDRSLRYSVATQNLFGLWSLWRGVDHAVAQPPPVPPRIVSATLTLAAPPVGKLCAGDLEVDLTWDWTDRRPGRIELTGVLYACAERGDPVPANTAPATLDRTPGGGQGKVVLAFTGDTATVDGAVTPDLRYLNLAGDQEVAPGPAQSDTVRRYRLKIPGFTVDFATTPHVGLALWAAGAERIAPHHVTPVTGPVVTFASDPVAPPLSPPSAPPIVPLGSLPDAEGRSHGRLSWPAVPGAAGYYVYSADEFTLLAHHGVLEPAPDDTLSARYQALLELFAAKPDRRPFTRETSRPVTGTSLDVALPKGSRAIHAYVVITAGPGSTEGPWPVPADAETALRALASPRIATPPPPELVAVAGGASGTVAVDVTTRIGPAVERVDVHRVRVDDAARKLETMGPPVASAPPAGGGWTAETLADGRLRVQGIDAPGESWKRVWYRAVAWAAPDGLRGLVRGASPPSNPFSLIVPRAASPDLSAVAATWPGGALAAVQLRFTSAAPVPATPLGPHRLRVVVEDRSNPAAPVALVTTELDLEQVPTERPATGSGLWREPAGYRVLVRRDASAGPLGGSVRLVDPLGRASEQPVVVAAGPVLPKPEIADVRLEHIPLRGDLLTFTSGAPVTAPPAGPYMLRVQAARPRPQRPLVLELALASIPVVRALPAGEDPLLLVRQRGGGGRQAYAALAQVPVSRFTVTLRSPDGRSATATQEVPLK